jgi:hypothetical protein
MKALLPLLVLAAWPLAPGAEEPARPRIAVQEVNPWNHLNLNNAPDNFQFAIVTDRTGGHRPGIFESAVDKLNLLQPEFVMSVGDLIEGYSDQQEVLDTQWGEFQGFIGQLQTPFFYVPGNHDISNLFMAGEWQRRFGPSYYHFVYRDVLFLCLNSEDNQPDPRISQAQIDYVARALAENPQVRWTLAFLHRPLWDYQVDTGWASIEELLKGRPHTVFAGHYHTYLKHARNNTSYFVLATTGGGSNLRGPVYGEFDHVVWVTMTGQGPRVANLMLEGIWDENIRTERLAALVDPLIWGGVIAASPIFAEGPSFAAGRTQVRLKNDADLPLQLKGRFAGHPQLAVHPDSLAAVVAPNSVQLLDLEVRTSAPLSVDGLKPLVLHWEAQYQQEELKLPVIEGRTQLAVSRRYAAPRARRPLEVDGDLGDWEHLPFAVQEPAQIRVAPSSWTGPADCSWRFGVLVGEKYLYLGIEVIDDRPVYLQEVAWQQDGIEVRVDGRSDPARSANRGEEDDNPQAQVLVALSPAQPPAAMVAYVPEVLAELGVEAACVPTSKGHNTEIAIPLAYFAERQGEGWREFRLNIAVDDFDEPTGPLAQLWWQPDWRSPESFAGSGTFRKE